MAQSMSRNSKSSKGFCLNIILSILLLSATSVSAAGFKPVPVKFVYLQQGQYGTADQERANGRVVDGYYAMAAPATRPWRIAFLFPHLKDPYWVGCDYGVISEARRLGVEVDILPADGYDDLIGQLLKMDQVIAAKYDAIVISPISLTANNPSIAKAHALGIPVFELANDCTSPDLTVKVTTSLKGMGTRAMQWVIHDARRRGLGSINIALLPGPADAGWVKGEVAGTREAARHSAIKVHILDIKYGDSDRMTQTQLAAQLLAKYGRKLNYILGCTGCAPAAVLPLTQTRLNRKVRIVSYDLTREIADLIREGKISAAADTRGVSQARVAIDSAVNYLEGRTMHLHRGMPRDILIKLGLVDRANEAHYPFNSSTAPAGFEPVLSWHPRPAR